MVIVDFVWKTLHSRAWEKAKFDQVFYPRQLLFAKTQLEIAVQKSRISLTRARLKSGVPDVVHFAIHGEFNERQPMQSGLLLSKDDKNDGRLQVHELFGLNLKNANLVTLSACQTALAKIESSDDMIGLSRGFIYAGPPALLASLWDVDDAAISTLMQEFYNNWLNKKLFMPAALRQAQLKVRNNPPTSSPYYWAAFELIGDWM